MKIRNGFVSNSSSSSYLLYLKREPESYEDFKDNFLRELNSKYNEESLAKLVYEDLTNTEYYIKNIIRNSLNDEMVNLGYKETGDFQVVADFSKFPDDLKERITEEIFKQYQENSHLVILDYYDCPLFEDMIDTSMIHIKEVIYN